MKKLFVLAMLIAIVLVPAVLYLPIIFSSSSPSESYCPAIENGKNFLVARYHPALGLLNESPQAAPHKYWLTNDNALAAYTFAQLGQTAMSGAITSSLEQYGHTGNGLIEVIWGAPVTYPPYVDNRVMIAKVGNDEIWQEFHNDGRRFDDWAEYANLAFLGALNEYHQGRVDQARAIYANALAQFDGIGFADKAFKGRYETYKLALALYTGAVIGAPNPSAAQMRSIMLSMQPAEGGFTTHYRALNEPDGDMNTETTALALLALKMTQCDGSSSNLGYTLNLITSTRRQNELPAIGKIWH